MSTRCTIVRTTTTPNRRKSTCIRTEWKLSVTRARSRESKGITSRRMAEFLPIPARNRRIGEFLKELRLAEGRGTGLPKIRRGMTENGSPEPEFDYDDGRTYFRVVLPAHPRYKVIHALRESALLWSTGERQAALAHLRRAFEAQPGSGALAGRLIDYQAASDDLPAAELTFQRFNSHPAKTEPAQPYLAYARAMLDRNRPSVARRVLDEMPSSRPAEDTLELAILLKRSRDFEGAHHLLSQIHTQLLDDPRYLQEYSQTKVRLAIGLGNNDMSSKRRLNQDAAELLRRAIQLTTDQTREAWCWFELAGTLRWLRAPNTEVEEAFLKALSLRPEEPRFERGYKRWRDSIR